LGEGPSAPRRVIFKGGDAALSTSDYKAKKFFTKQMAGETSGSKKL
jgi:hypothetical protein